MSVDIEQLREALVTLDAKSNEWWGTRMDGFTLPIVAAARLVADGVLIRPLCESGCGDLSPTVRDQGRMVHKHDCPERQSCQTHPDGCGVLIRREDIDYEAGADVRAEQYGYEFRAFPRAQQEAWKIATATIVDAALHLPTEGEATQ